MVTELKFRLKNYWTELFFFGRPEIFKPRHSCIDCTSKNAASQHYLFPLFPLRMKTALVFLRLFT